MTDQKNDKLQLMRRLEFAMTDTQARGFLQEAAVLHLALTRPDGSPVLRTLNAAVSDEWLLFHGSPSGEKVQCVGRPAVVQAEQMVATIPSYFTDPEKACPATTFFLSVQVHGTLEKISDPHVKADALQRIMQRYQPEGGHVPISFDNPMYQNAVRGVMVLGLRIQNLTGKAKLGQNKRAELIPGLIDNLWLRGRPGDAEAVSLMFEYHPETARPARFRGPADTWLWPTLKPQDVNDAVGLLENQYWTRGVSNDILAKAQLGATAWIGARDSAGKLVATARANSDGARHAYIADVAVAPEYRGKGLGEALMRLLLDHPAVRGATSVRLITSDAAPFYARFGFELEERVHLDYPVSHLLLKRTTAQGGAQSAVAGT